ncbi:kinesin-like protein [Kipferlia bialata]|uniref:Kinesin-like protein n=1 Tax=Kipferlia bialata TaxID=797122 RepID=A0A9K3CXD6_9EUKA|nr:kinesin-like protein [Kipferlia bialata]|eukprot:g6305.t1
MPGATSAPRRPPKASNFTVAVRVRPENEEEKNGRHYNVIKVTNDHLLVFDPPESGGSDGMMARPQSAPPLRPRTSTGRQRKAKDQPFAFDVVFDENATQKEVFTGTALPLVGFVLEGYNATMFAYGATGAGKTHTMLGHDDSGQGIMMLTLTELFARINSMDTHSVKCLVSYIEIYNEKIRDLLAPVTEKPVYLSLREDPKLGPTVAGLSEKAISTPAEAMDLLAQGSSTRTQFATGANAYSSRSHAILRVRIESRPKDAGMSADITQGKLSLIDLAGSERAARTKNMGARLLEGANINRSLLALGNCINALCTAKGRKVYVPYRDSKLTRLLKDSLGGNTKTVMINNISPSSFSYEDTLNTLKYANRAKQIKTVAKKNTRTVNFHVGEYQRVVGDLKAELEKVKVELKEAREAIAAKDKLLAREREANSEREAGEASAQASEEAGMLRHMINEMHHLCRREVSNQCGAKIDMLLGRALRSGPMNTPSAGRLSTPSMVSPAPAPALNRTPGTNRSRVASMPLSPAAGVHADVHSLALSRHCLSHCSPALSPTQLTSVSPEPVKAVSPIMRQTRTRPAMRDAPPPQPEREREPVPSPPNASIFRNVSPVAMRSSFAPATSGSTDHHVSLAPVLSPVATKLSPSPPARTHTRAPVEMTSPAQSLRTHIRQDEDHSKDANAVRRRAALAEWKKKRDSLHGNNRVPQQPSEARHSRQHTRPHSTTGAGGHARISTSHQHISSHASHNVTGPRDSHRMSSAARLPVQGRDTSTGRRAVKVVPSRVNHRGGHARISHRPDASANPDRMAPPASALHRKDRDRPESARNERKETRNVRFASGTAGGERETTAAARPRSQGRVPSALRNAGTGRAAEKPPSLATHRREPAKSLGLTSKLEDLMGYHNTISDQGGISARREAREAKRASGKSQRGRLRELLGKDGPTENTSTNRPASSFTSSFRSTSHILSQ